MKTQLHSAAVFCASLACVFLGISLADFFRRDQDSNNASVIRSDGHHYRNIVENGYAYDPDARSNVAFFPWFPCSAWFVKQATGLGATTALLLTSNAYLLGAFMLFAGYLQHRRQDLPQPQLADGSYSVAEAALLAFAFFPTTFFFRMPYAESSFLMLALLAMYGMARRWPLLAIALAVGAATATRPVGAALLPPLAMHVWSRSPRGVRGAAQTALWSVVGCWGLLAYMGYQEVVFGDPLAFAKTQQHWTRRTDLGLFDRALSLASLEPIWSAYMPRSPYSVLGDGLTPFSLMLLHPIYFVGFVVLVLVGAWKDWLSKEEFALSAALLFIPYLTRAYEWGMHSHGRFAAVVFPAYIVLGHLLARLPPIVVTLLVSLSAAMLTIYACLFAAGRPFF